MHSYHTWGAARFILSNVAKVEDAADSRRQGCSRSSLLQTFTRLGRADNPPEADKRRRCGILGFPKG